MSDLSAELVRHVCDNSFTGGVGGATLRPDPFYAIIVCYTHQNPNIFEIIVNANVDYLRALNLILRWK